MDPELFPPAVRGPSSCAPTRVPPDYTGRRGPESRRLGNRHGGLRRSHSQIQIAAVAGPVPEPYSINIALKTIARSSVTALPGHNQFRKGSALVPKPAEIWSFVDPKF